MTIPKYTNNDLSNGHSKIHKNDHASHKSCSNGHSQNIPRHSSLSNGLYKIHIIFHYWVEDLFMRMLLVTMTRPKLLSGSPIHIFPLGWIGREPTEGSLPLNPIFLFVPDALDGCEEAILFFFSLGTGKFTCGSASWPGCAATPSLRTCAFDEPGA